MPYFGNELNDKTILSFDEYVNFDCNEEFSINESIDPDEGFGNTLRPIFVVLLYSNSTFDKVAEKFVKNQNYWHAAISFGPALSRCYSFNFGEASANKIKGGLSFESISFYKKEHPDGTMEVNCFFINKEKYKIIKENFETYLKNKEKTKYSFINLFFSLIGKKTKGGITMSQVCSTFVDTLLKSIDIDVNNKPTNLVKPDDLMKKDVLKKQYLLYKGTIIGYDGDKVTKKVDKLSQDVKNDYFH